MLTLAMIWSSDKLSTQCPAVMNHSGDNYTRKKHRYTIKNSTIFFTHQNDIFTTNQTSSAKLVGPETRLLLDHRADPWPALLLSSFSAHNATAGSVEFFNVIRGHSAFSTAGCVLQLIGMRSVSDKPDHVVTFLLLTGSS